MHLINWKARRAGGRITVNGTDFITSQPAKIVGVDVIEPTGEAGCGHVRAIDKNGEQHTLAVL